MPSIVDSSGWIEYFVGGANADAFEPAILDVEELIVPTISLFEVYRWILREAGEKDALSATAAMRQGRLVDLDENIATSAADFAHKEKMPMADSIILMTARMNLATLYTQDVDLKGYQEVVYITHPSKIPK